MCVVRTVKIYSQQTSSVRDTGIHDMWYIGITLSLFIHLLIDFMVVSISWLLWIRPQQTWGSRHLFETPISLPVAIYSGMGFLDHMVHLILFYFSRSLHTVFHNGCANPHSHQQCTRTPFPLYLCQHLPFVLSITGTLTGERWRLTVVLIGTSLVVSDAEHLFMHLLAICIKNPLY